MDFLSTREYTISSISPSLSVPAEIRKGMEEGQKAGVQGTPTFFLGLQEPDGKTIKVLRTIVGAQPYAQCKAAIEWALGEIKK